MKILKLNTRGSVALISVLITSAILMIVVVGMADSQISNSQQYLNNFSDKSSYYTAEACLEEAIIRIEEDTSFTYATLNSGEIAGSCAIAVSGSSTKTISINVTYETYTQNFSGEAAVTTQGHANNVQLLTWSEI